MTREQALEIARRFDMRPGERRSRLADLILSIDAKARAEERARCVKIAKTIAVGASAGYQMACEDVAELIAESIRTEFPEVPNAAK